MMKKRYIVPKALIVTVVGGRHLLNNSLHMGSSGEKVDNTEDIGFVKDNTPQHNFYSVWDDDWQ